MRRRIADACARPEFWMCLLLLWITLSALRSEHTLWAKAALTEWLRWGAGISLALTLGRWLTQTRLAARLLVVCTGILAAIGVGDGLVAWHDGLTGPFRDHQLFGSALLVLLPMSLAVALTARETRWRWCAQGVAFTGLLCLVLTQTRSAWVSVAVAGVTFGILWWQRTHAKTERVQLKQALVPILLVAAVCLYFVVSLSGAQRQQSLSHRADTLKTLSQDGSWQARQRAWRGAERMVADQPLLGRGLGRYPGTQWQFTHVGRVLSPDQRPSLSEQAHNLYLQTTAETGVIGLVLYLAVLAAFAGKSLTALRRAKGQAIRSRDGFLIATLTLIGGLTVDSFASPSYQFAEVSLFVWAALGVGLSALNGNEAAGTEEATLPAPVQRLTRLATAGTLFLALLSQFVPLGLLTPVEAYADPTANGYVYNTFGNNQDIITYSPAVAVAGGTVDFQMLADYVEQQDHSKHHPQDVTFDGTNSSNGTAFAVSGNRSSGTKFDTSPDTRNHLVIAPNETSSSLTIVVNWRDGGLHKITSTQLAVEPASP